MNFIVSSPRRWGSAKLLVQLALYASFGIKLSQMKVVAVKKGVSFIRLVALFQSVKTNICGTLIFIAQLSGGINYIKGSSSVTAF